MDKMLTMLSFTNSLNNSFQTQVDIDLPNLVKKDLTGVIPINTCISLDKAKVNATASHGLLIKLKASGLEFSFHKYDSNTPLNPGEFAIMKDVILSIASNTNRNSRHPANPPEIINSLIAYLCKVEESIVVELSKRICDNNNSDDDHGGDGIKVRIPTP